MAELTENELEKRLKAQKAELMQVRQQRMKLEKRAGQIAQIKRLKEMQKQEVKRAKELTPSKKRTLIRGLKTTARFLGKAEREAIKGTKFLLKEERKLAKSPEAKAGFAFLAGKKTRRVR